VRGQAIECSKILAVYLDEEDTAALCTLLGFFSLSLALLQNDFLKI
jgi:hypothetical protein